MTPMSRIAGPARSRTPWRSTSEAGLALWHVGCCVLGGGCLYIAPIEMMPVNSPPEIQYPGAQYNEKVLIADVERLRVIATDADEDDLYFLWSGVPADVEIAPDPPFVETIDGVTVWTSIYKVPRDPRLDGRQIQVHVTDFEPLDAVDVYWQITVEK